MIDSQQINLQMCQQITRHINNNALIPKNYHIHRISIIKSNRIKQLVQKILYNSQKKLIDGEHSAKMDSSNKNSIIISARLQKINESLNKYKISLLNRNIYKIPNDSPEIGNAKTNKQQLTPKHTRHSCQINKFQTKSKKNVPPLSLKSVKKRSVTEFSIYDAIQRKTPTKFHPKCQHQVVRQYLKMSAIKQLIEQMEKQSKPTRKKTQSNKTLPYVNNKITFPIPKNNDNKINLDQSSDSNKEQNTQRSDAIQKDHNKIRYKLKIQKNRKIQPSVEGMLSNLENKKSSSPLITYLFGTKNNIFDEDINEINGWNEKLQHHESEEFMNAYTENQFRNPQTSYHQKSHSHWLGQRTSFDKNI